MSDTTTKRKGLYAAIVAAAVAMIAVANWTSAVDTLVDQWQSWAPAIGSALRSAAPWLPALIVLYGASALFITAFRELREGKRAREGARRNEIKNIMLNVGASLWDIESSFKGRDSPVTYHDVEYPLERMKDVLVMATMLERRQILFNIISNMEKRCIHKPTDIQQTDLDPFLKALHQWLEWAEWEVDPQSVSRPKDPLAPQR